MKRRFSFKKFFFAAIITFLILSLICISAILIINEHVKNSVKDKIFLPEEISERDFDCIIVLGCGLRPDGSPSSMLEDRLKRAIELYKGGVAPKIIMSGDHSTVNYDEVNTMKKYAQKHGVPEQDIFMDHAGFSTYESIYRAKEIFCVEKAIVVTQKYHLYRALYIADKLGVKAVGVDSDYRTYYGQSYRELREIAARTKDFFGCIIKPLPTYLGDTIPVSGNGTATQD